MTSRHQNRESPCSAARDSISADFGLSDLLQAVDCMPLRQYSTFEPVPIAANFGSARPRDESQDRHTLAVAQEL